MSKNCRYCNTVLNRSFCNLGTSPLANAFLSVDQLNKMEPFYPLNAYICGECMLVQLESYEKPEHIFNNNYAYFSSFSDSWLEHAKTYTKKVIKRFGLDKNSLVVEIASNDGYLLQYFLGKKIPVLGIEPAGNVAQSARDKGVKTKEYFFGSDTSLKLLNEGYAADLLLGNNILPHVLDLNDFVVGLRIMLKSQGVITMEFPHLLQIIKYNQFDTIYHEHLSYFSYLTLEKIFSTHNLTLFDVEELSTHGGSLRIYAKHSEDKTKPIMNSTNLIKEKEIKYGINNIETYCDFTERVINIKQQLLEFLIQIKNENKQVIGYGAPAKGNTLLNFCGIGTDFIDYTVDRNPYKQNKYLPGTHIPVLSPDEINKTRPDYILILPWNLKKEIMEQLNYVRKWGSKFILPIPKLEIVD